MRFALSYDYARYAKISYPTTLTSCRVCIAAAARIIVWPANRAEGGRRRQAFSNKNNKVLVELTPHASYAHLRVSPFDMAQDLQAMAQLLEAGLDPSKLKQGE